MKKFFILAICLVSLISCSSNPQAPVKHDIDLPPLSVCGNYKFIFSCDDGTIQQTDIYNNGYTSYSLSSLLFVTKNHQEFCIIQNIIHDTLYSTAYGSQRIARIDTTLDTVEEVNYDNNCRVLNEITYYCGRFDSRNLVIDSFTGDSIYISHFDTTASFTYSN